VQEIGKGRRLDPVAEDRVRMADLLTTLETDYANNGRRSCRTLGFRLLPLRVAFDQDRARDVTASRVAQYVRERLAAGKARATVNRELAALRRAFTIAVEQERLTSGPRIKMLTEAPPRQCFVNLGDLEKIVAGLPDYLRDLARFGFLTGWRVGEITTLEWCDVDREGRRITLRREHSKNGQPRVIPVTTMLDEIMARRWEARGSSAHVFHHNGRRIGDFRKAWTRACAAAGKPPLLFHDLRRSAVRNLVSAGVDQSVAMRVTGHKTVSVFQRYRIVAEDDVRAALNRMEAALKAEPEAPAEGARKGQG
jgi:integrase